ncbi:MAG: bifunctional 4-hydroxy-2-oxoglutarate aldolase/2-dehydro-3-deoxy-phosphogluconate aldolase [Firmicutes bacterium]|nr:bifunctional 4-hydroxy-2-oxoglutarate aldolase/2-dehydro-3-deoxy-phosphogluconate aldolase [Bacillota bacterium]
MTLAESYQQLQKAHVVPILRRFQEEQVFPLTEALAGAGITAMEITLDSSSAISLIASLREQFGAQMLVGAGTVMTAAQAEKAMEHGAAFLVCPHLDPAILAQAHVRGVPVLPGVFTATEVATALANGAQMLKLFPAGVVGPAYLKELLGPFHGVAFVPTGGVSEENAAAFLQAGAVALGIGGALFPQEEVSQKEWQKIAARARRLLNLFQE